MKLLLSTLVALFPKRYRTALARGEIGMEGAWLSGLMQAALSFVLFLFHYFSFTQSGLSSVSDRAFLGAAEVGGDTAVRGFGLILLVAFLADPVTLLLIYFLIEGVVRALAGAITREVIGTLPLHVLGALHGKVERILAERSLGPRIPDEVRKPGPKNTEDYDLLVASCRPKPDWHYHLNTISYEDELYEVAADRSGPAPRRFVYLLRKKPTATLVRGLHHYDPSDVLKKPEKPPGLKTAVFQGLKVLNVIAQDFRAFIRDD